MTLTLILALSSCAGVQYVHREVDNGKVRVMTTISDPNAFMSSIQRNYDDLCDIKETWWSVTYYNCEKAGADYIISETGWVSRVFGSVAMSAAIVAGSALLLDEVEEF